MWDYLCWNRRGDLSSPGWWGVKFSDLGGAQGLKQGRPRSGAPEFFKSQEPKSGSTRMLLRSYAPTLLGSWAPGLLGSYAQVFSEAEPLRNPGGSASCLEPPSSFCGASEEPEALPPAWSPPSSFLQRRSL